MRLKAKNILSAMIVLCVALTLFVPIQAQAKTKGDGSRENPYSAYEWHTVKVHNMWGEYRGTVKIKLVKYMDGKEALDYREKNIDEDDYFLGEIENNEQYVYMKFKIKCIKSDGEFWCGDIVDGIYNAKANKNLNASVCVGELSDGVENMTDCNLYKGGKATCASVHVAKKGKGNTPITFTIPTGEDSFTWFTTKNRI